MGLYFNDDEHPYLYTYDEEIDEPNQSIAEIDEWSTFLKTQKKANSTMQQSFKELNKMIELQRGTQKNQWKKVSKRLNDLAKYDQKNEIGFQQVKEQIISLDEKSSEMENVLKQETLYHHEVADQLHLAYEQNEQIERRLKHLEAANEQLLTKLNEQYELQKEMRDQALKQEEEYQEMIGRLDNQEAMTEKILRQVTNIRSILFERANHLAEKIEDGYQLTSSYIYQLLTGAAQPLQLFRLEQKAKEKSEE